VIGVKVGGELGRHDNGLTGLTDHDAVRGDGDQQVHGGNRPGVGQVIVDSVSEGGAWRR
jgi:hypothetical protein